MVAKLSSVRTRSEASRAASVPRPPMATPMSAALRAGASFTPSPVIATSSPWAWSAATSRSLCSGLARAITSVPRTRIASADSSIPSSAWPSTAWAASRPRARPTAAAVTTWSPVIILTRIPARRHAATAATASGRGGSSIPTRPSSVKRGKMSCMARAVVPAGSSQLASASTRCPCSAACPTRSCHAAASTGRPSPSVTQSWSTRSGAPFR